MRNKTILFNTKNTTVTILVSFLFVFLFTSCCEIGYALRNKENKGRDFYYSVRDENNAINYIISCEEISGIFRNHYTYEKNPDERRFQYRIEIMHNKRSAVKLNAFKLTNLDGTPIIVKYYVETHTHDTVTNKTIREIYELDIDSLPIVLRDSGVYKASPIRINVETEEPYSQMKNLSVYYDFEVGENHYVSENIKYKWRKFCDCRPKLW